MIGQTIGGPDGRTPATLVSDTDGALLVRQLGLLETLADSMAAVILELRLLRKLVADQTGGLYVDAADHVGV